MESNASDPTDPRPDWTDVAPLLDARFGGTARILVTKDEGAYSPASRWVVALGDGQTAFVKADRGDAAGVQGEAAVCAYAWGSFQPRLAATARKRDLVVLVAEDLSSAYWGVPLARADVEALAVAIDNLARVDAPSVLPSMATRTVLTSPHWRDVARDPSRLLATGLVDASWLDASLDALASAAGRIDVQGRGVVHGDLWRQNWCIAARGAVIVDWMSATRGNPDLNAAWGECAVRACAGPAGIILPTTHPEHFAWAAWMSGLAVRFLVDEHPVRARRPELWATQLREADAALRWACEALDLAPHEPEAGVVPTGPWRP